MQHSYLLHEYFPHMITYTVVDFQLPQVNNVGTVLLRKGKQFCNLQRDLSVFMRDFYAPGSNGGILFLSCLSVCLSVVNFNLRYNFWTVRDRDFIFGMHTPLMTPFQMTPRHTLIFIRLSSDGTYYGMVMSVRLSVRPVSVHPFSALFSYMLWHIELKFCTWLCFDVLQINFDCRHFASTFEGVMPLCELRIKVMCSFPLFSPTCFDILSSNFAYDFVSPYFRSSSSAVNLR